MPRKQDSEKDELVELLTRAEQGDETALPAIRKMLDHAPSVWQEAGNLVLQAERALVQEVTGENLLFRESLERTMAKMKAELGGSQTTPLERLLVDRVVACWLQLHYADAKYAQQMKDLSRDWGDYFQKRQDRAHLRYLSAIRSLALMRRLLLPAIQVNIAEKQVNQQVVR